MMRTLTIAVAAFLIVAALNFAPTPAEAGFFDDLLEAFGVSAGGLGGSR